MDDKNGEEVTDWEKIFTRLEEIQTELECDLTSEFGEGNYTIHREFAPTRDAYEFTAFGTVAGKKIRMDGGIPADDLDNPQAVAMVEAGWWANIVYYLNEHWPNKEKE